MPGIDPKDVILWLIDDNQGDGMGHAVAFLKDYFAYTACGTLTNTGTRSKQLPALICPDCLTILKTATALK